MTSGLFIFFTFMGGYFLGCLTMGSQGMVADAKRIAEEAAKLVAEEAAKRAAEEAKK